MIIDNRSSTREQIVPRTVQPVRFASLGDAVADRLRNAIIEGDIQPGERLVEQKLASDLETSQQTVRVALHQLGQQGFVRKIPHRGTYVTKLIASDFQKIQSVRLTLEVLAIEAAAVHMTASVARSLRGLVDEMATAVAVDDRSAFHRADLKFHSLIWDLAGNEYLKGALERLVVAMFAFVLSTQTKEDFVAAVQQHKEIVEGLCSRDPAEAGRSFLQATTKFWKEHHRVENGAIRTR
jgi:DNA-binding GntR family transcriptional regulator